MFRLCPSAPARSARRRCRAGTVRHHHPRRRRSFSNCAASTRNTTRIAKPRSIRQPRRGSRPAFAASASGRSGSAAPERRRQSPESRRSAAPRRRFRRSRPAEDFHRPVSAPSRSRSGATAPLQPHEGRQGGFIWHRPPCTRTFFQVRRVVYRVAVDRHLDVVAGCRRGTRVRRCAVRARPQRFAQARDLYAEVRGARVRSISMNSCELPSSRIPAAPCPKPGFCCIRDSVSATSLRWVCSPLPCQREGQPAARSRGLPANWAGSRRRARPTTFAQRRLNLAPRCSAGCVPSFQCASVSHEPREFRAACR